MKLHISRMPGGAVRASVEGDLPGASDAPETIRAEARRMAGQLLVALRAAEETLAPAEPDLSAHHAPRPATGPDRTAAPAEGAPREHYPPCEPPPSNGKDLWKWAYNVGACKRVLALGAACGYPARTRADVYRWFPDNAQYIYHELTVKPVKGDRP